MRTIIDLSTEQLKALTRFCEHKRISRAEAIRRAVDHMVQQEEPKKDAGFGAWKHKRIDGRKFVDKLRAEWER